ncbi:MAG: methylenetetrahydromethanopterin dehydrogenase [Gammaproteobacteria bacterium]|nr:methylenetetrahydromethanopterin dehydrogenase [Gammaproteobacteria bacterium]
MSRDTILHLFTAAANASPFDVNMAIDAGWQHCVPYTRIASGEVADLTQDAIFSRGPKGVKRTGIFIGGRDIHVAMEMLDSARKAMVPPFQVSVFADPSGAFTTAAGMVACVEKHLAAYDGRSLSGQVALVFGGTGPVGMTCAMLAAKAGARAVIVSHEGKAKAQQAAASCAERYAVDVDSADGSTDQRIRDLLADADVVFSAAKAGIQVVRAEHLADAQRLRVLCDVNAVPPAGIAGVGVADDGVKVAHVPSGALGIGALAVGNVKYQTQQALLRRMLEAEAPEYLHFEHAFAVAREKV